MSWNRWGRIDTLDPMKSLRVILLSLGLLLIGVGCKDSKKYTLDNAIRSAFGVDDQTPAETAAATFNEKDPDIRRQAIEKLSNKSWALRDPYLKRFAMLTRPDVEPDPAVRAVAVRTLGKAGNPKYQRDIVAALDDPDSMVRWDAAVVLNRMPDESATTRLQFLAIDPDQPIDVRAAAATALRQYRTDSVYKTLLRCLDDDDFTVRNAAHESLVAMTGRDFGYVPENWAGDPDRLGEETLPQQTVRYRKRPWWDWMKVMKETEPVSPDQARRDAAPSADDPSTIDPPAADDRPWWDWFGTTDSDESTASPEPSADEPPPQQP